MIIDPNSSQYQFIMTPLFKKLNLTQQTDILVLHAPASFETELHALHDVTIHRDIQALPQLDFSLVFANKQAEVDAMAVLLAQQMQGDVLLWFAYPKATSKSYSCEFNRDTGWDVLRSLGFDTVRQVAIDDDWSALRFRRVQYIKVKTLRGD
jgi:hypothetical protein